MSGFRLRDEVEKMDGWEMKYQQLVLENSELKRVYHDKLKEIIEYNEELKQQLLVANSFKLSQQEISASKSLMETIMSDKLNSQSVLNLSNITKIIMDQNSQIKILKRKLKKHRRKNKKLVAESNRGASTACGVSIAS